MFQITSQQGSCLEMMASGRLRKEDYKKFVPRFEQIVQEVGPLHILIRLEDLDGAEPAALWEDLKFDSQHQNDMTKIAIVGNKDWQEWGTRLSKPFFKAEIRYFNDSELDDARRWLWEPTTTWH